MAMGGLAAGSPVARRLLPLRAPCRRRGDFAGGTQMAAAEDSGREQGGDGERAREGGSAGGAAAAGVGASAAVSVCLQSGRRLLPASPRLFFGAGWPAERGGSPDELPRHRGAGATSELTPFRACLLAPRLNAQARLVGEVPPWSRVV